MVVRAFGLILQQIYPNLHQIVGKPDRLCRFHETLMKVLMLSFQRIIPQVAMILQPLGDMSRTGTRNADTFFRYAPERIGDRPDLHACSL